MPMLRIGTRAFHAEPARVANEAERMFKLSPDRRRHRLEAAKTKLVRAIDAAEDGDASAAASAAAAIILSQGIDSI